jgi:hypothetical protein
VDPNGWVAKDELFRYFMEYCEKHGLPRPSKTQVGHDLPRYAVSVKDERRRTGGTMERGWQGIKYTSEEEQKHESDSQREGPTLDDWQSAEDPPSRRD